MHFHFHFNGSTHELHGEIAEGETATIEFPTSTPAAVAVFADGAGAVAEVQMTLSSKAALAAGTARWVPAKLGSGGVISGAIDATDIPAPIRALRIANLGVGSVFVDAMQ